MKRTFVFQLACALFLALEIHAADKPRRVLIVGQSPDGHPPLTHEFMAGARVMDELLKKFPDIQTQVVKAGEPWLDGAKLLDNCDGLLMLVTQGSRWMQTDSSRF